MPKIWMRLGVSLDLTDDEVLGLKKTPGEVIARALKDGRVTTDGDSYFPDEDEGSPDCCVPSTPIISFTKGEMVQHKLKILNPYRLEKLVCVVFQKSSGEVAHWILYDGNSKELYKGKSWRSKKYSNIKQSMINCQARGREYIRKKMPMLTQTNKRPKRTPDGVQQSMIGDKPDERIPHNSN